jgi:hypothetical protein
LGYSWSHSEKEEDDVKREGIWAMMYNGLEVEVKFDLPEDV